MEYTGHEGTSPAYATTSYDKVWVADGIFHTTPLCSALDHGQRTAALTHVLFRAGKIPRLQRCQVCARNHTCELHD